MMWQPAVVAIMDRALKDKDIVTITQTLTVAEVSCAGQVTVMDDLANHCLITEPPIAADVGYRTVQGAKTTLPIAALPKFHVQRDKDIVQKTPIVRGVFCVETTIATQTILEKVPEIVAHPHMQVSRTTAS